MSSTATTTSSPRLQSLDALRGFDMPWIIGGEVVVRELARWLKTPALPTAARQLEHVSVDLR